MPLHSAGRGKVSDAKLGVSAQGLVCTFAVARRRPPYNLDEGGGAPARGTHAQALNPKP